MSFKPHHFTVNRAIYCSCNLYFVFKTALFEPLIDLYLIFFLKKIGFLSFIILSHKSLQLQPYITNSLGLSLWNSLCFHRVALIKLPLHPVYYCYISPSRHFQSFNNISVILSRSFISIQNNNQDKRFTFQLYLLQWFIFFLSKFLEKYSTQNLLSKIRWYEHNICSIEFLSFSVSLWLIKKLTKRWDYIGLELKWIQTRNETLRQNYYKLYLLNIIIADFYQLWVKK